MVTHRVTAVPDVNAIRDDELIRWLRTAYDNT
jgi:hypothetical protein